MRVTTRMAATAAIAHMATVNANSPTLSSGDITIGDTALDSPSDAERARRKHMKREG